LDLLTFITKLIDALAWPIAAIVLVALLRKEISALAPFIRKIKAGPLEAEFEREVRELRSAVEAVRPIEGNIQPSWQPTAEKLAELNPRSAILEAWREVETTARGRLQKANPALSDLQLRSTREVVRLLGETGLASSEEVAMINEMRYLRNQAVHVESFRPTYEASINFVQLAAYLLGRIDAKRAGG